MKMGAVKYVTLYDPTQVAQVTSKLMKLSINAKLLRQGYAQIDKHSKCKDQDVIIALREQQDFAKFKRMGMFEYGDFDLQDDGR